MKNLSPKEYLEVIRLYLRDLINEHKPTDESNDESDESDDDDDYDDDTDRTERKIQLTMQNSCISNKSFEEETGTICLQSEPVEIFMGSNTNDVIDRLFNTLYKDFNMHKKHQMIKKANLFLKVLNYYIIIFKK